MKALRLVILCFVLLSIFGFGLFVGSLFWKKPPMTPPPPQIANTATVLTQVQSLAELVTVKYVFEKVVNLEDPKWYGESRVTLVAHGIVKAGVDFNKLTADDLHISNGKVTMKLAQPVIFEAFLDDKKTQVLEHSTGLLRTFDKDLQQSARKQALTAITRGAREMGIEREAEQNARKQIEGLLRQLGFAEIDLQFK